MLIEKNILLSEFATFKIGGRADFFCRVQSLEELKEALFFAKQKKAPIFILGGGSNLLISDEGFRGLVIKMEILGIEFKEARPAKFTRSGARPAKLRVGEERSGEVEVSAYAGENWDYFVSLCVEKGLYGLENLSGIPGTVGGAIFQNIGAYGAEISECVSSVEALNTETGEIGIVPAKNCAFSYRGSIFKTLSFSPLPLPEGEFPGVGEKCNQKKRTLIILKATFSLSLSGTLKTSYKDISAYFSSKSSGLQSQTTSFKKGGIKTEEGDLSSPFFKGSGRYSGRGIFPNLIDLRSAILSIRSRKLPDLSKWGCAGSFFKNPIISKKEYEEFAKKFPDCPAFAEGKSRMKLSAGWLLDKVCNLKGAREGDAGLYENQALVLVNYGSASAEEIKTFAEKAVACVLEKTGIILEGEVEYV